MEYGNQLKDSIIRTKQRMIDAMDRRDERIANWETDEDDCFMSIKVEQDAIRECNLQLDILDGDGCMDFDAIFDADGNEVYVKWVHTRYGGAYVGRGVFASSKKALLKKTGWHEERIRVPAWTKFVCNGSGFCGVYSGQTEVVRWHTNMVTGEYVGYPN